MATNVNKIDSNVTGLHFCEEASLGVLPAAANQVWYPLEPNSYTDFGGQIKITSRNPILASRQRKKGVTTDLDASGGLVQDLTQTNLTRLLQGFMFADFREKYDSQSFGDSTPVTDIAADGTDNGYESAAFGISSNVLVRSLIYASGFSNGANNGLKEVSVVTADTDVDVTDTAIVDEVASSAHRLEVVGYRFASATVNVVNSGSAFPYLDRASGVVDWTTFGLIPGEWVWIGGDDPTNQFVTDANNTWARVYSVTSSRITFDKTGSTMVSETGTGLQIDLFFGKVLKNEADPELQVRRSYTLQRKMGAPDTAQPDEIQSEYIKGAVASTLKFTMGTAALITAELGFIGIDNYTRTGVEGPLSTQMSATEVAADNTDAFNTTSHVARLKMGIISLTDAAPSPLFAYVTDLSVNIDNNLSPAKAVSVLGAFDITAGQFAVSGTATAYFTDPVAVQAVRDNADVSLDFALVHETPAGVVAGIVVDLPLNALGDARAKVELNKPIMLPLSVDSAPDRVFDHTLLFTVFDYLPDLAAA